MCSSIADFGNEKTLLLGINLMILNIALKNLFKARIRVCEILIRFIYIRRQMVYRACV
jgi:hypothetical protein